MAAPRSRGAGPVLLLRAIGRLALLVSLGFGVGLVIGVAIEEPRLLLGHLRGESESVRLVEAPYAEEVRAEEERAEAARTEQPATDLASVQPAGIETGETDSGERVRAEQRRDSQAERLALRDLESDRARTNSAVAAAVPRPQSSQGMRGSDDRVSGNDSRSTPSSIESGDSSRWAIQVGAFADERSALGLVDQLTAKRYPVDLIPSSDRKHRWRVRIQPIRGKGHAQEIANRLKQEEGLPTWLILLEANAR